MKVSLLLPKIEKTRDDVLITKQLLPLKSSTFFTFLCVRVCECARACARSRERQIACVRVDVGVGARALACAGTCSLSNPACNAPPFCHLRPLWLHHIYRHYLINGTIFGKKLLDIKRLFRFFL